MCKKLTHLGMTPSTLQQLIGYAAAQGGQEPPEGTSSALARHRADLDSRTLRLLGRNRRLSKEYEYCVQTAELMIDVAAMQLMLNRVRDEQFSNTLLN